tara:strand:+ start:8285 stop:8605 length:321 start_codon:yes stop_codon:yes gene_type:complete
VANQGTTAYEAYSSTTEIELMTIGTNDSGPNRGFCFVVYSTQAGTAEIFWIDPHDGTHRSVQTQACSATTVQVIDFDFRLSRAVLKFTPDAATAGTVSAEGLAYGG